MSPLLTRRRSFAPWRELEDLEDRLLRLYREAGDGESMTPWSPAVDITESDEEFRVTAEIPGLDADDVDVEVEEDELVIRGEKKTGMDEEGEDYHITERSYGEFSRRFSLPSSVDADAVTAEMKDGVLTVRLPKTEPATGRRIEISGR